MWSKYKVKVPQLTLICKSFLCTVLYLSLSLSLSLCIYIHIIYIYICIIYIYITYRQFTHTHTHTHAHTHTHTHTNTRTQCVCVANVLLTLLSGNFGAHAAIPLSKATIFGVSVSNCWINFQVIIRSWVNFSNTLATHHIVCLSPTAGSIFRSKRKILKSWCPSIFTIHKATTYWLLRMSRMSARTFFFPEDL